MSSFSGRRLSLSIVKFLFSQTRTGLRSAIVETYLPVRCASSAPAMEAVACMMRCKKRDGLAGRVRIAYALSG
jgi:hypothetical protein